MIEFFVAAVVLMNLFLLMILAIVYYSEKEMDDAFPMTRRREKARMMREEYGRE